MFWKFCQAYFALLCFEFYLARDDFAALHHSVRRSPLNKDPVKHLNCEQVCRAIDLASVFYPRQVWCLQRSAATAVLLRRYGVPAELVIGVQLVPFKSHAWVEAYGRVVNDKSSVSEQYAVLERC
jgi:hypothetical protein